MSAVVAKAILEAHYLLCQKLGSATGLMAISASGLSMKAIYDGDSFVKGSWLTVVKNSRH